MECMKCQGLMVHERVSDGFGCIQEWRCINCGLVLDPVIEQNRLSQARRHEAVAQPVAGLSVGLEPEAPETFTRTISLLEVIGENCISDAHGRELNSLIEDLLNEGHTVTLDFHGVKLVTPSFYRAVVGNLSCSFPEEFLDSSLNIVGLAADLVS
jgi:hypothetical protein